MTNLAAQFQDIAVMMAAGQSPFMTIMQQGMQIVPVLGDGQNGIGGAMKRLGAGFAGFLTNPLNIGILGFAALAFAAQTAYEKITSSGNKNEQTLEKQKKHLDDLKAAYGAINRVVGEVSNRQIGILELDVRYDITQMRESLKESIAQVLKDSSVTPNGTRGGGRSGVLVLPERSEFGPFKGILDELRVKLEAGTYDVQEFQAKILKVPDATEKARRGMAALAVEADNFQRSMNAADLALDPLASKLSKLYSDPRKFLGNERENTELYSFVPDNRSKRDQIEASYADVLKTAAGNTNILIEAENARRTALSSLSAELDKTIALQNLDIQSIYAKTPAQKAAIAAEREYINAMNTGQGADETAIRAAGARKMAFESAAYAISEQTRQMRENTIVELASITAKSPAQKAEIAAIRERNSALNSGVSIQEANTRASMAASVAMAQAENQIREANRARLVSANDNIAQQKNELELVGKSAYQRSLQTANLASYLDLQRQATQNGLGFDKAQYDLLVKKNEEMARYVDLLNEAKLNDDLDTERRKLGMSESDGAIFDRLKGEGIKEGSSAWTRASAQIKSLEEDQRSFSFGARRGLEDVANAANDFGSTIRQGFNDTYRAGEEMWMNFARTGKISLDGLKTTAIDMLSKLTYQMATSGLLNMFSGGAAPANKGGGILNSIFSVLFSANGNAFNNGNVMAFANGGAFTNSVVSKPTAFPLGMMGEAGPEAVMPLTRTSNGKLGVVASGGGGDSDQSVNVNMAFHYSGAANENDALAMSEFVMARVRNEIPVIIQNAQRRSHA
jgi:lambda family phage tail tape measure protein